MKKILIFFVAAICCNQPAISQELANPSPNLQSLPGGSYVIAMDNTWQTYERPNPNKRYFNLKAYGLVVHLLNNNVKVKRIIRSGKGKDEKDFTAPSVLVKPTVETVSTSRDFAGGPFVVLGSDIFNIDIDRLIDNYNTNAAGVSGITSADFKVKVYKTTTAIFNVDVRHDLSGFLPKASILNDGGNAAIHQSFMQIAGIPASNYMVGLNTDLTVNCFTFASEPHNGAPTASVVQNIKNFVQAGGNFLAQCDAINSYEALGKFHSTNGFTVTNSNPAVSYPNADIAYAQFEDVFSVKQGGSVQNWMLASGSSYINGTTHVAGGSNSVPTGASVSKVTPAGSLGGYVYYLGNHSYSSNTDYNHINGIRMYMNAFLTPAYTQGLLKYQYTMSCNSNSLQVSATSGPGVSYPVTFRLYADVGTQQGAIDGGDAYVGIAQVSSSGSVSYIFVSSQYSSQPLLLLIQPSISCFPSMTVSPNTCYFAVLPHRIINFFAKRKDRSHVQLQWNSVNEENVQGYRLKRKVNDQNWETLNYISSSKQASGTSHYSITDINSFSGRTQYKIEEVSGDGRVRETEIKIVENKDFGIRIFPNPATGGKFMIEFKNAIPEELFVYDITGRRVRSYSVSNNMIKVNNLQQGIYSIHIMYKNAPEEFLERVVVR